MITRTLLATVAAIAFAHPPSAQAQFRLEVGGALGAYLPAGRLPLRYYSADICIETPEDPECLTGSRSRSGGPNAQRTFAVGGRWTAWLGKRGAIEGAFWYSPSDPGTVVMGSMRAVVSLAPQARTMSVILMGGPALIHRSGFVTGLLEDPTAFGGVLGIGLDMHPGHSVGVRAQIDDHLYRVGRLQQDFVVSFSVGWERR